MAKRFIDTDIFSDGWFMELPKDAKLLYIYLFTNCDHAGIIEVNQKLVQFLIGIKDLPKTLGHLGNRIIQFNKEKPNVYFLPKFIKFQYPDFPKSNVKQQESALKILNANGIDFKTYLSVKDTYDNDNDNDNDNEHKETKNIPSLEEFLTYAKTIKIYHPSFDFQIEAKYNAWVGNNWKDGNNKKITNWKTKLQNTMPHFKIIQAEGYHNKDFELSDAMKKRLKREH